MIQDNRQRLRRGKTEPTDWQSILSSSRWRKPGPYPKELTVFFPLLFTDDEQSSARHMTPVSLFPTC